MADSKWWNEPKQRAALGSLLAAIFLVIFKLYVGLITNSLGILAEALHSSLDLVAAGITMLAVHASSRPADEDHPFGHGKSENISALAETVLLILTCAWIFFEAYRRIFIDHVSVQASLAGFLVMGVSMIININRSRTLYKVAKKYNSQALEADALHFSSDILSSAVVILGLIFVSYGWEIGDPLASTGVGIIIVIASLRLGKRTFDALMDRAPVDETEEIRKSLSQINGINIERIRARVAGPNAFVDVKVSLDRRLSLEASQALVSEVEKRVRTILKDADIMVQVDPKASPQEDLPSKINQAALTMVGIRHVHNIKVYRIDDEAYVELHIEVNPNLTVKEAHDLVSAFEEDVKSQLNVKEINTHIETRASESNLGEFTENNTYPSIVGKIKEIAGRFPEIDSCHDIQVRNIEGKISANLHIMIKADMSIIKAHELTDILESTIRAEIKELSHVTIHVEPVSTV